MLLQLVLGLGVGIPFGFFIQRGRFCVNSASQDLLFAKDVTILKLYAAAVLSQLILVNLLGQLGVIRLTMPPFFWLAASAGGFIFGIGAALAGGCSSGSCYRIGEGLVGPFVAVVAFAIGAMATQVGALRPVKELLRGPRLAEASLPDLLGVNPWLVIIPLAALLLFWLLQRPGGRFIFSPIPIKFGVIIGLIGTAGWLASSATGRGYGISVVQPISSILQVVTTADIRGVNWGTFVILGLFLGSFIGARGAREFRWRTPSARRLMQQFGGGLLMGFGGVVAGGCTVGHGLTGVPILSATSWLAMITIVMGIWATGYIRFIMETNP